MYNNNLKSNTGHLLLLPAATANWVPGTEAEGWMGKGEKNEGQDDSLPIKAKV